MFPNIHRIVQILIFKKSVTAELLHVTVMVKKTTGKYQQENLPLKSTIKAKGK